MLISDWSSDGCSSDLGYTADWVAEGPDGLHRATSGKYDALVVDRMLPGLAGLAIVKALRAAEISVPVLILSALAHVDERVTGLRAGGDDYLSQPFASSELHGRLEALLRSEEHHSELQPLMR